MPCRGWIGDDQQGRYSGHHKSDCTEVRLDYLLPLPRAELVHMVSLHFNFLVARFLACLCGMQGKHDTLHSNLVGEVLTAGADGYTA